MSDYSNVYRDDPPVPPDLFTAQPVAGATSEQVGARFEAAPVATVPSPGLVREVGSDAGPIALLVGAAVALVGGLVWAGVVIATHYDVGILAWLVGAATGAAVVRVAGGPVGMGQRVVAGALAAGAIMVGKYVIFVHAVKTAIGAFLASQGVSVGYLDTSTMSVFFHNFTTIVRPMYALWVALGLPRRRARRRWPRAPQSAVGLAPYDAAGRLSRRECR